MQLFVLLISLISDEFYFLFSVMYEIQFSQINHSTSAAIEAINLTMYVASGIFSKILKHRLNSI